MKNLLCCIFILSLSACAENVRYVNVYPNFPKFPQPEEIPLKDVVFDFPKTIDGKRDVSSNLFIGMDEKSFQALIDNEAYLKAREAKWKLLLDQINANIDTWQKLNKRK